MKKYKNAMIFGLTAFALLFCGMLPTMIAKVEDNWTDNKIYYEDMKTVQFMRELVDIEKVFLLKTGSATKVSEDKTRLKSENMREIVESALEMYLEQGFIIGTIEGVSIHSDSNTKKKDISEINENSNSNVKNNEIEPFEESYEYNAENAAVSIGTLDNFSLKSEPFLYYSNTISNLSGFFWKITMECWDDLGQTIVLYLDDQTGKVILISYECLEPIYENKILRDYTETLFASYQKTMDWFEYDRVYGEDYENYYDAKTITYYIGDIVYGEIYIKFVVTQNGFRILVE